MVKTKERSLNAENHYQLTLSKIKKKKQKKISQDKTSLGWVLMTIRRQNRIESQRIKAFTKCRESDTSEIKWREKKIA